LKKNENSKPLTSEELSSFQVKLIQDVAFIEQVMSTRYISELNVMLNWIKAFNVHITGEGKLDKDYPEYRRHFKNWIVKQDTSRPPPLGIPSISKPPVKRISEPEITAKYGRANI
jgi:hypothetical protein